MGGLLLDNLVFAGMERAVWGGPADEYRYRLSRTVGPGARRCLFIMLNPSTANDMENDPTVRRCIGFARNWGFGVLEVVNLFALRSTDPHALYVAMDPVGPENERHILAAARLANTVVCAWGAHRGVARRGRDVLQGIKLQRIDRVPQFERLLWCLGRTKDGHPRHPLYLPAATALEAFP